MAYIDLMKEKAKSDKKTIVLPETTDKRTLIAASNIIREGIANIIMIGNEEKIYDGANWLEVDLTGVTIIDPETTDKLDGYVELLYETRKNKGMTPEKAREILLKDYLTFGVIMVKANDADGMVAGANHATADTLRPALQILKTAPGVKLVSGFFLMDVPDCEFGEGGTFLFADCDLPQEASRALWAQNRLLRCFPIPRRAARSTRLSIKWWKLQDLHMRCIRIFASTVNYRLMRRWFPILRNPNRREAKWRARPMS